MTKPPASDAMRDAASYQNHTHKDLPALPDVALSCDGILHQQYHLYQPKKGYRFGTDAILLSAVLAADTKGKIADFGAGAGAVAIATAHAVKSVHITAFEKDDVMAKCLSHNIALNALADRISASENDITNLENHWDGYFDHIIANPPFHAPTGTRSRQTRRALAHHGDDDARLADWVDAALKALKPNGRLHFILRADRTDEMMALLRSKQAGGIVLQPVWPYKSSPAIRVIVSAQKDVKAPFTLLAGLVLHHPDGGLTAPAAQILQGEGAGLLALPSL